MDVMCLRFSQQCGSDVLPNGGQEHVLDVPAAGISVELHSVWLYSFTCTFLSKELFQLPKLPRASMLIKRLYLFTSSTTRQCQAHRLLAMLPQTAPCTACTVHG
jgi:hypothetical protein